MNEQQQAAEAVSHWARMAQWLDDVEAAADTAPVLGSVDEDQIVDAREAFRAARLAAQAMLGGYFNAANPDQPGSAAQRSQTAHQAWTQRSKGQSPPRGSTPAPEPAAAQPQHFAGWSQ